VERPMMDAATAARAIDGTLRGPNAWFSGVSTDSRSLAPGDLFVAIKGGTFDGHEFVSQAFERGAAAAIVAVDPAAELAAAVSNAAAETMLCVTDPIKALGALAKFWRRRFSIPVAAIVGSNGKTTVKEMAAAILRAEFGADNVLATAGNLNNEIGLPLTILRLRPAHSAAAVEIGMNHPGETATLSAIAQPTAGVINNAQREHQEFMKSVADVAAEHASLLGAISDDGFAVINADDDYAVFVSRDDLATIGITVVSVVLLTVLFRYTALGLRMRAVVESPRMTELAGIDADRLYRAINRVKPTYIRVEADEATYGLHIILRFELEQELIEGRLSIADLPEAWNARFQEYFGIAVTDDADGVLQDVHWSAGMIGYFPTYALGNLIAGQLWEAAQAEIAGLDDQLAAGELGELRKWLRRRVHRHGAKFATEELLEREGGGPISVAPFVRYLKAKLSDVYGVDLGD